MNREQLFILVRWWAISMTVALNFDNTGYNSLVSILSNDDEVNQGREMLEEAGLLHESSHYPNYYANFVISDIKVINKCKNASHACI